MRITVLSEDETADSRLAAEHGLSLLIGHGGATVLFDTGASGLFAENAGKLGIDLAMVDFAVLSHGHYDHAGGLADFLELNPSAPVYMKPEAAGEQYASPDGAGGRYIGADRRIFEKYRGRIRFVSGIAELSPGCFALCDIAADPAFRTNDPALFAMRDGSLAKDDFRHELFLVLMETGGMAVISGCSHSGIVNIAETAKAAFPGLPVIALAGGLHLFGPAREGMNCEVDFIDRIAERLASCGKIYAGHCTGSMAFGLLKERLGGKLMPLHAGTEIVI